MVLARLTALAYDEAAFWAEAAERVEAFEGWYFDRPLANRGRLIGVDATIVGAERLRVELTYDDGKTYAHLVTGPRVKQLAEALRERTVAG